MLVKWEPRQASVLHHRAKAVPGSPPWPAPRRTAGTPSREKKRHKGAAAAAKSESVSEGGGSGGDLTCSDNGTGMTVLAVDNGNRRSFQAGDIVRAKRWLDIDSLGAEQSLKLVERYDTGWVAEKCDFPKALVSFETHSGEDGWVVKQKNR